MNPDRYTWTGFNKIKDSTIASAQVLSKSKLNKQPTGDMTGEVKEVQVKTANKAVRIMR